VGITTLPHHSSRRSLSWDIERESYQSQAADHFEASVPPAPRAFCSTTQTTLTSEIDGADSIDQTLASKMTPGHGDSEN
jgi:hypothetical protein